MSANAIGRPSIYSPELADSICLRLESGESLAEVCDSEGFPNRSTVFRWLSERADFKDAYARARLIQAEMMVDEIAKIADTATPESYNVARLQVDTRKWIASKRIPKSYGDATMLKHADADGNQLKVEVTRVSPRKPRPTVIDVTPTPALPAPDDGSDDPADG